MSRTNVDRFMQIRLTTKSLELRRTKLRTVSAGLACAELDAVRSNSEHEVPMTDESDLSCPKLLRIMVVSERKEFGASKRRPARMQPLVSDELSAHAESETNNTGPALE